MAEEIKVNEKQPVVDGKNWWESKTIWALIVPAVLNIYIGFQKMLLTMGIVIPELPPDFSEAFLNFIVAICVVAGIYFRIIAKKIIK